ncbi:DEAD/DEAH box helicase [Microbulbifer taiwanensis]|uniref:DEAD/DEAH box helicase n=1 Tax=Microbulbifer taiwanensis TaxID=986746 RepID=UPI00360B8069
MVSLDDKEIQSLTGYSSILSLSDTAEDVSLSYEIATRLLEYTEGNCNKVISAADIILSRIGNFPGRSLLRDRYLESNPATISAQLRLECLAREAENTFHLDEKDDKRSTLLTDFQYKFLTSLNEEGSLSVSAPTSAGKSFVLNIDLVRKIKSSTGQCIVYVVPTRALISEVAHRVRTTLRSEGLEDVIVRTAPFPIAKDKIGQAAVYIFTQERLMSFINSQEGEPIITSLIIDEAHEIQNGKRGIILQNAIDISLSRFGDIKVLFASPLIKNPGYFLNLFSRTSNGKYFVEQISPVSQNLILVSEVKGKPKKLDISILTRGEIVPVSTIEAAFKFRGNATSQRANLTLSISNGTESVISFSNNPSQAEKVACRVAELSTEFEPNDEAISFAEFVRREIHPDYPLADCVLKGVAFHYGNMPSLVRSGVENLFKNGSIKIICCTSTLLQGVNLPAKHIVIENPMSGESPMTRADFLNLAGRAGRLLKEFHGNIWCIRPSEWNSECYNGDRLQEINSAISTVMEDGGLAIQKLLSAESSEHTPNDEAEAAFGKIFHDYLIDPQLSFIEGYRSEENSATLDETVNAIKQVEVSLPIQILENNQSLRPDHLQNLFEYLSSQESISELTPLSPYTQGAKARMEEIFLVLATCFEWNLSDPYRGLISYLAYRWVWGIPIGKILADRVEYVQSITPNSSISSTIRGCLSVLEEAVRFRLVKYFSAYIEILKFVAIERGLEEEFETIEPYHIYLEFGSCNRHALNLMALGISRFTALYMESKFDFDQNVEAEEYLKRMSDMNIDAIKMPPLCKKEIIDLLP